MNLVKIGSFLKELRKEKELSQEELAEKFFVSRRSVSRWETGSNMPDMDILIELSDFYGVDLREILNGEREKENMDNQMKDTVLKVAEYDNENQKKAKKITLVFLVIGTLSMLTNVILNCIESPNFSDYDFCRGLTLGIAFSCMILGILYLTGILNKIFSWKCQRRKIK